MSGTVRVDEKFLNILVRNPEGKRSPGSRRIRWKKWS
jgi:hypothetical protein